MLFLKKAILFSFISLFLIACESSSDSDNEPDNNSGPETSNDIPDNFVGFWDETYTDEDGTDVMYQHIYSDGRAELIDFVGDSYDNGPDCYVVIHSFTFENQGDNAYLINDLLENEQYSYNITVSADNNTINYIATDGRTSFEQSRVTNLTLDDVNFCTVEELNSFD